MKLIITLLFLCIISFAYSQEKNYNLQVGVSPILLTENRSADRLHKKTIFDNQYFKIVQFYEHPTRADKQKLKDSGVELISYLPHYAWLVAFNSSYDVSNLPETVRAVIDVPLAYKLSKQLQLGNYPDHIVDGESLKLSATFFNTVSIEKIENDLNAKGFTILALGEIAHTKSILIPIEKVNEFATLPYVQYIEPILPPPTLDADFRADRNNERANYLASEQTGGLKYDGTGITLAVKEGGTVNPTIHNDFKGRLDFSYDNGAATASHKTNVAWRMAGYGNDDPFTTGMAFGSDVISTTGSFTQLVSSTPAIAVNNSYGFNCYTGNYGTSGNFNDDLIYNNPTFMIAYSAGNIGDTDCGYGAGIGWGTTTGDVKQAKNVLAVGALNTSDQLMSFSSWGPAPDGRIKPDLCAVGPGGTSYACPNVVGGFGQLYHAYFTINGVLPNSGLIKGILQNTADDLGNPGPDFKYGYGRINMRRAYETIANNTIISDNVANSATDNHIINVPAGTKQVRIMLYWTDYEGTVNSTVALVNDLNLTVTDPNTTVHNPWVLDHTKNSANLNANAIQGVDALNNMEQVTIDNPTAGNHTITVNGFSVPQGPQDYFIVYEFLEDEVTLTYPIGGEAMIPGETQRIYWDSYGNTTGTFDLSYSTDNGATWTSIITGLSNDTRFYDWAVPSVITGEAKIKVERGALSSQSAEGFSIISIPNNLIVVWSCADSLKLGWDALAGATGYEIYKLGTKYMTSVGTTTNTHFTVNGVSTSENEYFAVRALGANNAKGRRTNSIEKTPGDSNCVPLELAGNAITSHSSGYFPDCYTPFNNNVRFQFLNTGVNAISSVSVSYQLDNGSIQTETFTGNVASGNYGEHTFSSTISILTPGSYTLKAWVNPSDANATNDTATSNITIYSGGTGTYPFIETFDAFSSCSNSSNCNTNVCTMTNNWYNVPYNTEIGDDADWLTRSGNTPTGGGYDTGPSGDHTTGAGKYLYTETSLGSGCQESQVFLLTPCINLSTATKPELSFWYHMYGANSGTIWVDILNNGTWKEIFTVVGEQGNVWLNGTVNLIPYVGQTVIFRFRALTGSSFQGDMAIDDITIQENVALPVELAKFSANAVNNEYIELNWSTNSELNNEGFEILRSTDGTNFYKIGYQEGKGTTFETSTYQFNDYHVQKNTWYYYQLRQIDFDGTATHSKVESERLASQETFTISEAFPNPTNTSASIRISTNQELNFDIKVYNALGQLVEQKHFVTGEGSDLVNFDTKRWSEGLYFIDIQTGKYRISKKLMVHK